MTRITHTYDALVIGARCAGAATAMLLARAGKRVLVVDWSEAGADTMSTHALMRGATAQLARWGLLDGLLKAGTPLVTKTTFIYEEEVIPVDIRPSQNTPGLIAPRRNLLDATLVKAARDAGAEVRFRTSFRDVIKDDTGRVTGARLVDRDGSVYDVHADIVIGADGRRSTVAKRVGSKAIHTADTSVACIFTYVEGLQDDGYRWYYAPELGAGVIPTNDAAHCVFVAAERSRVRNMVRQKGASDAFLDLLSATNPALGQDVRSAKNATDPVFFSGEHGFMRQAVGAGWALVGDAGYFKDPLTAHGITDALRDAEILARAVIAGSAQALRDFQDIRDELSWELFELSGEIAKLDMSMEQLKAAHLKLNTIMKGEQKWMADAFKIEALAA